MSPEWDRDRLSKLFPRLPCSLMSEYLNLHSKANGCAKEPMLLSRYLLWHMAKVLHEYTLASRILSSWMLTRAHVSSLCSGANHLNAQHIHSSVLLKQDNLVQAELAFPSSCLYPFQAWTMIDLTDRRNY